ncbi:cytochrome d ubiquinol oxidase subunit II [Micrococcales bacterium 31B]|nr:cytochrome d ubiquinol oxidase subunit II [Micrococcales bacterium 31B]
MDLQILWFCIIGLLFTVYFVLEGFDFGVGMLMLPLGRGDEKRRRAVLNTIGPVWDGNEVWLLTAGGAMFAAFPDWYATLFSGFYLPLFLILLALILRIMAIDYRGKINDVAWRRRWDLCIAFGSWLPALLWGVAFANLVRGVEVSADKQFVGGFFSLLNPYALLGGLVFVALFALHGALYIALKTTDQLRRDAISLAMQIGVVAALLTLAFGLWTQLAYGKDWTWAMVALAVLGIIAALAGTVIQREGVGFIGSTLTIVAASVLLFGSLFPNLMPSTLNPAWSLTVAGNSSTEYTLTVMTWCAVAITPIVIGYQTWAYWVFRHRISVDHIPPATGLPSLSEIKRALLLEK